MHTFQKTRGWKCEYWALLYINTYGMPLVQSKCLAGTSCCIIIDKSLFLSQLQNSRCVCLKVKYLDLIRAKQEICLLSERQTVYWNPLQHRAAYGKQIPLNVNNQQCVSLFSVSSHTLAFLPLTLGLAKSLYHFFCSSVFRYPSPPQVSLILPSQVGPLPQ